jgi:ubiquinone/menaquinone biosynthesis C-methylase UbiE
MPRNGELMGSSNQEFACPECQTTVVVDRGKGYLCQKCSNTFPVIDNIPVFSGQLDYYGEIKKDLMSNLLVDAEKTGYHEALRKYLKDPWVFRYAMDESRAKWIEIIPHSPETRVLDVGCGWGTNAIPMSRCVKEVVALDGTYERVKFVEIRARQERLPSVVPVVATALKLPFPAASFDVVTFNGVIEWLGLADKRVPPRVNQERAIGEAYRVLKPGGKIYIGIENRFSLRYWLGQADDHSFMRFTSLLPRWLADVYCRWRTGEPYLTHTYSLNVCRTLLTGCGFTDVESYFPWPTYRNPDRIVPLRKEAIVSLLQQQLVGERALSRRGIYLRMLKVITQIERQGRMCHSFCFVASKPH